MAETKKVEASDIKEKKDLDYFGILKDAFSMVRHNRYLWYLGILAGGGFGSGFSGGGNPSDFFQQDKDNSASAAPSSQTNTSFDMNQVWSEVVRWMQDNWLLVAIIASTVVILIVVMTILSCMAKSGLVHSVDSLSKNEESSFGKGMRFGWHRWWRVFGASFLIGLVVFAVFLALGIPVITLFFVSPIIGVLITILVLPVFFFIAILSGVIFEYALRYISLKEGKAVTSIKNGMNLMKNTKKETFFIWLITVGVAMVAGIVLIMAMILVLLILVLLGLLFFILSPIAGMIYAGIAIIAFVIAIFTAGGFLSSLVSAYWTLCFKELEGI